MKIITVRFLRGSPESAGSVASPMSIAPRGAKGLGTES